MKPPDSAQLSQWFRTHGEVMVLYARQWLPIEQAEDAVQDVFLRLADGHLKPKNLKPWLYIAVRHAALNAFRSGQRRRRHERICSARQPLWFQADPGNLIDAQAAQRAMESLPVDQRELIVLRLWAGMTFEEIAGVAGRPASSVFAEYAAAMAALRKAMGAPCGRNKT